MSQATSEPASEIPTKLDQFAELLDRKEHALAAGGDDELAAGALDAAKCVFDLALSLEPKSHPHLHPFLVSILQPPSIQLRSSTKKQEEVETREPLPEELLPYTPLSVLTTDGMDAEQVWAQLELRNEGICKVVKEVNAGETGGEGEDDEDAEDGFDDSDEDEDEDDDSQEEMTVEEWKRMMAEEGYEEGMSDSDLESEEGSEDDEGLDMSDEDVSLGSDEEGLLDEDEDDEDEDEEEGSDEEDDEDMGIPDIDMDAASDDGDDGYAAGPSKPRKRHATLDDDFFSIDDFNRLTEEQEAGRVTSGALGGDEDDEAELDDVGAMFLEGGDEDAPVMYSDFFDAPTRPAPGGKKGKGKEGKKSKKSKKRARFASEDEDEDEDEPAADDATEAYGVMDRVKTDLFDESEDEDDEAVMSTHEKRQRELAAQIAELEQQAVGPKDWTLMGEATARARPENSLLEETLDFEHTAKIVPTITEESVATLEELIKKRILDNNFDSPVRVRAFEPTPFLPSRMFELQDTQSTKSLAQIYEDDFQAAASGGAKADPRDEKLRKEHDEIDRIWDEICYKLDALSSLNFVPKQPKAQIKTIDNIATTSMESALPPTQAATTMLAPHELFGGPAASELVARSEQTPEEAKAARSRARKSKKAERSRLATTAQLYGKRKSVKQQKDEALESLVKSGRGVTVIGKGSKEDAKRKKRDEGEGHDAKKLKL